MARYTLAIFILFALAHDSVMLGCAGAPSPKAETCMGRYAACAAVSQTMDDYIVCRTAVDKDCMPQKVSP